MSTARPAKVAAKPEAREQPPADPSLLFRLRSNTSTLFLFGSIHVARKDIYPLKPAIERAFDASDALVLEIVLNEESREKAQQRALENGVYPRGDSLQNHVTAETLELVKQYAKAHPALLPLLQMKPWLAATTIMVQELTALGYSPERGLDAHFQRRAQKLNKPTIALETAEEQLSLLSGMDEKVQDLMLQETLQSLPELGQIMEDTFSAWQRGDSASLEKTLLNSISRPEYQPVFEKLFLERNRRMADKIRELLQTDRDYFVVVGSGHLVGQGGLVDLLKDYGPVQR